jgi:hypothetical protein
MVAGPVGEDTDHGMSAKYSMEFIASVSLDNDNETSFLTPALEEFLISKMSRNYNLLNSVGY